VFDVARRLIDSLQTTAPPKGREEKRPKRVLAPSSASEHKIIDRSLTSLNSSGTMRSDSR
jgi:hypothetical protein